MSLAMTLSVVALIAANLVPLVGALFFGWDVAGVFALYWSENVVVGAFTLLRILLSGSRLARAFVLCLFFALNFGLFCAVHAVFVVKLVGDDAPPDQLLAAPLRLLRLALASAHGSGLIALAVSHGVSFATDWLRAPRQDPMRELMAPYRRILVMHLTVLAGGFLMFATGRGPWILALLVVAKTTADVHAHRAELRRKRAAAPVQGI